MKNPLFLYYVDDKYINYLHNVEPKVPQAQSYYKNKKFYCGVVFSINGYDYFAPVSSCKDNYKTSIVIKDKNTPISSIRFSFMVPVDKSMIKKLNIDDSSFTPEYKILLAKEIRFIKKNEKAIRQKASKIYQYVTSGDPFHISVCCDFKKLEVHLKKYKKTINKSNTR